MIKVGVMDFPIFSVHCLNARIGSFLVPVFLQVIKIEATRFFISPSEDGFFQVKGVIGFAEEPDQTKNPKAGIFAKMAKDTGPFWQASRISITHNCPGQKITLFWPDGKYWVINEAEQKNMPRIEI